MTDAVERLAARAWRLSWLTPLAARPELRPADRGAEGDPAASSTRWPTGVAPREGPGRGARGPRGAPLRGGPPVPRARPRDTAPGSIPSASAPTCSSCSIAAARRRRNSIRTTPWGTAQPKKRWRLEIKILDYGDIELESSFLVLGRDCGRTRRVPTLGFLILGGPWPIVVDTGYRSNQIMETLGMRGLQFHENMIENQLARHGVRMGDVRYVLHTHLHIDHAGKDDLFPMNTTVVVNRRELEYSVSGLMHPQYPAARHQAPDRPAAHQGRAALPRSRDLRPIEICPGVYCEAAGAHTEGSMNVHVTPPRASPPSAAT